jgi:hypothetical protein
MMAKMHLVAKPPNEGARRLAWWIGTHGATAFAHFARSIGSHVGYVDRILAGEIVPGEDLARRIGLTTGHFVARRDWRRPACAGWFDPVEAPGGTLTIDDPDHGGSDAGAWATAIAHTPALRAQVERQTRAVDFPPAPASAL